MTVMDYEARTYPKHLLEECQSGLLLFASGRMGSADGQWFREAGLEDVTAVDWDEKTLEPFSDLYPDSWLYLRANVFDWVYQQRGSTWDIVSADAPSQHGHRLTEMLPAYCALAEKFVTATMSTDVKDANTDQLPPEPAGWSYVGEPVWRADYMERRYWWLVLEKA